MKVISFNVDGIPQSQGSKTAFVRGGRAILAEARGGDSHLRRKAWRQAVSDEARVWLANNGRPAPIDDAVQVTIVLRLPRPKSTPKRVSTPHRGIDVDKAARSILDSLTGLIFTDDARVVDLRIQKTFAIDEPPGARITVSFAGDAA